MDVSTSIDAPKKRSSATLRRLFVPISSIRLAKPGVVKEKEPDVGSSINMGCQSTNSGGTRTSQIPDLVAPETTRTDRYLPAPLKPSQPPDDHVVVQSQTQGRIVLNADVSLSPSTPLPRPIPLSVSENRRRVTGESPAIPTRGTPSPTQSLDVAAMPPAPTSTLTTVPAIQKVRRKSLPAGFPKSSELQATQFSPSNVVGQCPTSEPHSVSNAETKLEGALPQVKKPDRSNYQIIQEETTLLNWQKVAGLLQHIGLLKQSTKRQQIGIDREIREDPGKEQYSDLERSQQVDLEVQDRDKIERRRQASLIRTRFREGEEQEILDFLEVGRKAELARFIRVTQDWESEVERERTTKQRIKDNLARERLKRLEERDMREALERDRKKALAQYVRARRDWELGERKRIELERIAAMLRQRRLEQEERARQRAATSSRRGRAGGAKTARAS